MNNAQLINQDSGNFEYYTPKFILDRARAVMGSIELDVASSAKANETVQAERYYTIDDDALSQDCSWAARTVWMNHPFSRANNKKFIEKLDASFLFGDIQQACCITFASTSEKWFRPLYSYPLCLLSPRTNYYLPDGTKKKGVTKGSVVAYMGPNIFGFIDAFSPLGHIMLPKRLFLSDWRPDGRPL